MTQVIVAQNCPRCGAEPKVMYDVGIGCPYCVDMFAMPKLTGTYEDAIIEWNKLGVRNYAIESEGKIYIEADALIDWLDKMIEKHSMKIIRKDLDGNIIEEFPSYITGRGQNYNDCKRRVEKMVRGLRLKDGVEE